MSSYKSTSQDDQQTGKDSANNGNLECESNAFSPDRIKEEPIEPDEWERMEGASAMTSDFHQSPKQDSLLEVKEENDAVIESLPIHFDSSCSGTQSDPLQTVHTKHKRKRKEQGNSVKEMIIRKNRSEMLMPSVRILPKPILPSQKTPPNYSNIRFLPPQPTQHPVQFMAPPAMQLNLLNNTNVLPIVNPLPFVNAVNTSIVPPPLVSQSSITSLVPSPVSQSVPPAQESFNPKIEQVFYTGWKKDLHGVAPNIGIPLPVPTSQVLIQEKKEKVVKVKERVLKPKKLTHDQSRKVRNLLDQTHKVQAIQPHTAPVLLSPLGSNQPINQWPIGSISPSNNLTFFQPFPFRLQPSVSMLYQPPVINVAAPNPLFISGTPVMPAPMSLSVNEQSKSCHSSLKPAETVTPTNPSQVSGAINNCITPASVANQFIFFQNTSQQQSAPQQTPAVTTMCSTSTASLKKNSITKTQSVSSSNVSSVPNQTLNNLSSASTSNVVINGIPCSSAVAPSNLLTSFPTPVGSMYHPNLPILHTVLPQQGSLLFQNGLANLQGSQLLPSMSAISMNTLNLLPNLASVTTTTPSTSSSSNKTNENTNNHSTKMAKIKAEISSILNSMVTIQPKGKKKEVSANAPENIQGGSVSSIAKPTKTASKPTKTASKPTKTASKPETILTTPMVHSNINPKISNIASSTISAGNTSPFVLGPLASSKLNLGADSGTSDGFSDNDSSSICEDSNEKKEDLNPIRNWFVDIRPNPRPGTPVEENVSPEDGRNDKDRKIQSPCAKPNKNESRQEMSLLSFHGDVELLKGALVKCTVPLKRLCLSDDQLKDALSYDNSKFHCGSVCETESSELSYEMKKDWKKKKRRRERKSPHNRDYSVKKKKMMDRANARIKTKTSHRPSRADNGNLQNQVFREWVPLEVVGDLTIKGRMIEYSLDDVGRGRARRSTRIENKPSTDYADRLYYEDSESEMFSSGSHEDERTSKCVKKDVGEKEELFKEENVESDDVDELNQVDVKLEEDDIREITKTDKMQKKNKRKFVKLLDLSQTEGHKIEEIVYKSIKKVSEEDGDHYSSESDSDLFEEEVEVDKYRAMDNMHKMHHLMKRHNEVTVYLLKYTDKFSTFQELDKTIHVCKVCKLFKTNGLFRLFKHLRKEHGVD